MVEHKNIREKYVYDEIFGGAYDFNFNKEDIVLNIGGNVGYFDLWASPKVKHIYTYEPSKSSYDRLMMNVNGLDNITAYNIGVSNVNGEIDLFEHELSILTTTSKISHLEPTRCMGKKLEDILSEHEFTKIKCDIECAEYDIFICDIPQSVNEIILETHILDGSLKYKHDELMEYFRKQGFNIIERHGSDKTVYIVKCYRGNSQ